jgi:hypothetical protein
MTKGIQKVPLQAVQPEGSQKKFFKSLKIEVISWFVELGFCQIHWSCVPIIFLAGFAGQGVLSMDPTDWLDGV